MMPTYKTHNDLMFPDHIVKMSDEWIDICWAVTWKCNIQCTYCFKQNRTDPDIINTNLDAVVAGLDTVRQRTGKNIFFSITGGEPFTLKNFPLFVQRVSRLGMRVGIATNLTVPTCKTMFDTADTGNVMIQATYHNCVLDLNKTHADNFIKHFRYGLDKGAYCIFKFIVRPEDINTLDKKIDEFKNKIGRDFPVYLKTLSAGTPGKTKEETMKKCYPYAYTPDEASKLFSKMTHMREYQKALVAGAGWFKGMLCDAGRGLITLNADGAAYPCTGLMFQGQPIGNILSGINLSKDLMPCPSVICGCTPQGVWYGKNPWDYIDGIEKEDASYCKYGCPQAKEL